MDLPELLALLYRGGRSLRSIELTAVTRTDHELTMRAIERLREVEDGSMMVLSSARVEGTGSAVEFPRVTEETTRLWIERPEKVRQETTGRFPSIGVRNGDTWWLYTELQGAMTNNGERNHSAGIGDGFEMMLEPAAIIPAFDFEIVGHELQAGRPVVRVRARRRPFADRFAAGLSPLPVGSDDCELTVDAEHGTLLRVVGLFDGETAVDLRIVEIAYDVAIPPETFIFEPPPGETIEDVTAEPRHSHLPIEEAVRRASFTVFIATGLDEPWRLLAMHLPPRRAQPVEHVHLSYFRSDATHSFQIDERPSDTGGQFDEEGEWEQLERNGGSLAVIRPGGWRTQGRVRLTRDGTSVEIWSENLSVEQLLDVADGLRPVD